MDKYMYWLDRVDGLGKMAKKNLIQAFGSAEEVYRGRERLINCILEEKKQKLFWEAKKQLEVDEPFEKMRREEIQMLTFYEKDFPERLRNIPDAPFCIYYKGLLPKEEMPSVAVIGARECSDYGRYVAMELGKLLGEHRIQVISGMARGIDGISQYAALQSGGRSFGVLGCGVDVCYPKSNKRLYEELVQVGGVLSEYPPGKEPLARLFPSRNRIVSGLADVLVVIEARQKSGTAITVEMALEQGRDIYAVPGRITDRLSDGCNKMMKEGAHVFLSPSDFIEDLKQLLPDKMSQLEKQSIYVLEDRPKETDTTQEDSLTGALLKILDFYPQSIGQISALLVKKFKIKLRQEELSSKLMYMCLLGLAKQNSTGWFSKGGTL